MKFILRRAKLFLPILNNLYIYKYFNQLLEFRFPKYNREVKRYIVE